jgi:hypothetical protein
LRFLFFSPARSRVYQAVTLAKLEEEEQARFSGEQGESHAGVRL